MLNVQEENGTQPPDWAPRPEQVRRALQTLKNAAYPHTGRTGIGAALRKAPA